MFCYIDCFPLNPGLAIPKELRVKVYENFTPLHLVAAVGLLCLDLIDYSVGNDIVISKICNFVVNIEGEIFWFSVLSCLYHYGV